jgi:sugar lactone lactonase YvrE
MRRISQLAVAAVVVATLVVPAALAKSSFPETIQLPNGWQPEGIAIGSGTTFYAGSRATGAVYTGDLRTGLGKVLIQGASGRAATGMKVSHNLLWVSGAGTGKGTVYDLKTGAVVREYQLAQGTDPTFVNDVVVTSKAAYFTDSSRPVLYRVAIGPHHTPGDLTTIPLGGDYQHLGGFNLNGIDATDNGRTLLAVQTASGKLFAIDAKTGVARAVDLGTTTLTNGDGILLRGLTLYVVQNQSNQIAVLKLRPDLRSGSLKRTITDPDFDVPTTIGLFGNKLYAVNARFSTPPTPDTPYQVVKTKD